MNFKYKWSLRKCWVSWIKSDIKRWYYSRVHKFDMDGLGGTMIPKTGKGKFVSVYSKGQIIQIKHESGYDHLEYDEIRIIPCQYNHGVMIERFKNGKLSISYVPNTSIFKFFGAGKKSTISNSSSALAGGMIKTDTVI